MLNLFGQSVILQNVNDPDKNQDSLALVVCGWDTAWGGGMGLHNVDAQEKRVVHIAVALEKAAVLLYGGH